MDNNFKVSIILPTYNGEKYLRQSIESCLNQTYKNIELIIVDDASSDQTPLIIKSYADKRIRYIRHRKNLRLPGALNTGLANATGDYITWTSDDNQFLPTAIAEMLDLLLSNNEAGLVFADYWAYFLETGEKALRTLADAPDLKKENQIGACFLFSRKAFETTGYYDPRYELVEDYEYWIRMCRKVATVHYPRPLYIYGEHSKSLKGTRLDFIVLLDGVLRHQYGYITFSELMEEVSLRLNKIIAGQNSKKSIAAYVNVLKKIFRISKYTGLLTLLWLLRDAFRKRIGNSDFIKDKSVCFITETLGFGGTEVHTMELIRFLIFKGYEIELISSRHIQYDEKLKSMNRDKIKHIHTDLSVSNPRNFDYPGWKSLLANISSKILIFPRGYNDMGSIGFLRLCRKHFRKIYYIEHLEAQEMPPRTSRLWLSGMFRGFGLWWHKEKLTRKARSFYADKIIAVSNKVAERLVKDCFYPSKKIIVVQNGVDWRNFERNEVQGRMFRERQGIAPDAFIFGMVTRLSKEKGIDIALKAFHQLLKKELKLPVNLIIAGEGKDADKLREMAKDLGIERNVRFLGFVQKPQDFLSACEVIFFPSRSEGLPLGLLEGMASGCLPIVSNISGMPEVVNSPQIGWVVENEDIEGFSAAMHSAVILDSSDMLERRERVIKRIKEHFDIAKSHAKITETFGLRF
jgi:glycosyltransferase involved in cell wall biosynthesis/GT2 family glycosyltransferase